MLLLLSDLTAFGKTIEGVDGFEQVGAKHMHLYCKELGYPEIDMLGNLCLHYKHENVLDAVWSTGYVLPTDTTSRSIFVYKVDFPVETASNDFVKYNKYFISQGYEVISSEHKEKSFSVTLCKEDECMLNSVVIEDNVILILSQPQ